MSINKALATQLLDLQRRLQEAEGIVAGLFDGPVFQSTNIQPRMCSGVTEPPVMWNATAHALGCQMNNGRPVLACVCGLPNKDLAFPDPDLTRCPQCGGPADNGHDRCLPPNPYACSKCQPPADSPIPAMPGPQECLCELGDPMGPDLGCPLHGFGSPYHVDQLTAHARELERRLSEATRRADDWKAEQNEANRVNCTLQAQVQTLAEALRLWQSFPHAHLTSCDACARHHDNSAQMTTAALASLEVKP